MSLRARAAAAAIAVALAIPSLASAQPAEPTPQTRQTPAQQAAAESSRRSEVGFTFGAGYSDNLFKTNPQDDGRYAGLGVQLDVNRESRRLLASALGSVEYRDYSTTGVKDEPYGDLEAAVDFRLVPDRVSWLATESYGEGRANPFMPSGPANREQINVFETGPAVFLPLGPRTELRMSALKGQRSVSSGTNFDSDSLKSSAGVYRVLSPTSEIGVAVNRSDIDFASLPFGSVIDSAFVAYSKQFAAGMTSFSIGANQVESGGVKGDSNPYVDFLWARDVAARSRLEFDAGRQLIDLGDGFRGGRALEEALLSVDVYERTAFGVTYVFQSTRSIIRFGTRWAEDDYQTSTSLSNDLTQLLASLERRIKPDLGFGFDLIHASRDFKTVNQQDEDSRYIAWLEKRIGRKLAFNVTLQRDSRGGRNASPYDENSVRATVRYALNPDPNRPFSFR